MTTRMTESEVREFLRRLGELCMEFHVCLWSENETGGMHGERIPDSDVVVYTAEFKDSDRFPFQHVDRVEEAKVKAG